MEKKNAMLLTVIAVATLLVAVVGATFAYFSIEQAGSASVSASVSAQNIGLITISPLQEDLTLSLTAADMAESNADQIYYAVGGKTDSDGSHGDETPIAISQMAYTGGEQGSNYVCPVQVEVTADGNMVDNLETGWSFLELTGTAVNGTDIDPKEGPRTLDLSTLKKSGVDMGEMKKEVYKGRVTVKGPTSTETILSAKLYLKNVDDDQNAIANSTLNVHVKVTPDGECTYQKAE